MSDSKQIQQSKAPVPIVRGELAPTDFEGVWRIAAWLYETRTLPHGVDTPAKVALVIAKGMAIGADPIQALENIMIVNNRCTVWGDLALGLVRGARDSHTGKKIAGPIVERVEGEGMKSEAVCIAVRIHDDGSQETVERRFAVSDAVAANLWGKAGPWKQYPKRMLQMRARAYALRDAFPDILKGIGIREEVDDYQPIARGTPGREADTTIKDIIDALPQRQGEPQKAGEGVGMAPEPPPPAQADLDFVADVSAQMEMNQ